MGPSERLKILYVITKSNFGGAQRYVYDLARAARDAGQDVAVAFGGDGLLAAMLRREGIRTLPLRSLGRDVSPGADLRSLVEVWRVVRAEAPDVLHLNSSKAGALGALAARLANLTGRLAALLGRRGHRVAVLFTGHGWAFNEDRSRLARAAIGVIQWLTVLLSHCTIAVSEATRRQVEHLPFLRRRLVTVHNGAGAPHLLDPERAWRAITGATFWEGRFPTRPPLVLGTLSELHANKGLRYAVEAVALVRRRVPGPFVFAVLGEGEQRRALADQVRRLGLDDTVLLAGFRERAAELLGAVDVFVLSSITEAFPYALLEAGGAGLAVVATRVGGVVDLIEDHESGLLVAPRSPDDLAVALEELIVHPALRERLGRRIQERVCREFSVAAMAARTFALYAAVRGRIPPQSASGRLNMKT